MDWKQFVGTFPDAKVIRLRGYSIENFAVGDKERYQTAKIPMSKDWTNLSEKENKLLIDVWTNEKQNGWLGQVIPDGVIILDVDNKHNENAPDLMAEIIIGEGLKCHSIVTPNGRQFMFKSPEGKIKQGAGMYTPLGIVIDTRTTGDGQIVLPTPNTAGRYFEYICEEELDTYPDWLQMTWNANGQELPKYPISEGGRNDFLFRWACKIASQGQSKEQVINAMRLINKYLVKPSVDAQEVENVIKQAFQDKYVVERNAKQLEYEAYERRSQWWETTAKGGQKFLHYVMADYIMEHSHIVRYGDESGILYYYDVNEGYYKIDANMNILNGVIRTMDETLTIQQVREVTMKIYQCSQIVKEWDRCHIPLKNGLWNIEEKKLVPFTPQCKFDYKIDIDWNHDATSDFIDDSLNKFSNFHAPTRANLEECLGSIISPNLLSRYVWFLFGRTAHNGKSSFGNLIAQLVDKKFIGTLLPHDVGKSQFKLAELYGKRVNWVDETGEKPIPDFDKIKMLVTGGYVPIEKKGKDAFTVKLEVPQVWASNHFPNIREEGNQVNRRLEIIPFDYNFSLDPNKLDDNVAENMAKVVDSRQYLLKLAIEGMYRLIANMGKPSDNEKRNEQKEEFIQNNDRLAEWLDECFVHNKEGYVNTIDDLPAGEIYKSYKNWCNDNDIDYPISKQRLKNELMKRFNLVHEKKRLSKTSSFYSDGSVWRYLIKE
jgi:P4 family phage/plasmid primase-like protien